MAPKQLALAVVALAILGFAAEEASAYYQPKIGRFINRDPIGYNGSKWNLYSYVDNKPLRYGDPYGLEPCCGDEPCCEGEAYDPDTQCCKDGVVEDLYELCIKCQGFESEEDCGHGWIEFNNLRTCERGTHGSYRSDFSGDGTEGVQRDKDLDRTPDAERCQIVCGYNPKPSGPFDDFDNNCTTWACDTWKDHTGETIDPTYTVYGAFYFLGNRSDDLIDWVDNPDKMCRGIESRNRLDEMMGDESGSYRNRPWWQ